MGPELALALAAGGTAAQMIGARQQQKEQRAILNRAMERTAKTQQDASRAILDEAGNFAPDKRQAAMQAAEDAAYQQAVADTGGAQGGAAANVPEAGGNVSADYVKARADRALSEGNRLTAALREAAKVRAPGQVQTTEANRRAALTGDLNSKWSTTRNLANADQMDAESVDMPWYGQLGKLASAVGSAAMMMPGQAGTLGVTGADGAFLGEGVPSGVAEWDRAAGASKLARAARPRIAFWSS